ncbi:hypothetical protein SODG_004745 [Sodalis praecaptivus]
MATTQTRPEFTDTYWIIPEYETTPYGKVSFTPQDRRTFNSLFKDSRLIWAGRQPVQGMVKITPPSTITEIVTVQGWHMSNFVAIQNTAMPVVEYQGKRVVTFAMIDKAHGRPKGTASRAFSRNRQRFIEGKDFFKVNASEFNSLTEKAPFKEMANQKVSLKDWAIEPTVKKARGEVVLITEPGYLLLVKPFGDDLSWDVQRQMVDAYFRRNTLGELRHVEIPSLEELREMPPEKAQHIVAKAEKESSYGHGKPGSAAMTLRRKELKQIRPAIRTLIDLHQISICDLGDFAQGVAHA